jgi:hypothetical protein
MQRRNLKIPAADESYSRSFPKHLQTKSSTGHETPKAVRGPARADYGVAVELGVGSVRAGVDPGHPQQR